MLKSLKTVVLVEGKARKEVKKMSSDAARHPKAPPFPPPYVIVAEYPDRSGMNVKVMSGAQVETQPDGSIVIRGKAPGYVYSLDAAVHMIRGFRGEFMNK
jgi:hypothetical protein